MVESFRPLVRLWTAILSLSAVGLATLQVLGPPAARGLRHDGPQTVPLPASSHAEQPVAAASLPSPAAFDLPSLGPLAPPVPAQPSRRRTRSLVRKGVASARLPGGSGTGDDSVLAERGEPGLQSEPSPQGRDVLPPESAHTLPSRASAYQHVAGYIGVFTTGADGTRVFKSTP